MIIFNTKGKDKKQLMGYSEPIQTPLSQTKDNHAHPSVVKTFSNKTPLSVQSQNISPSCNGSNYHLNESANVLNQSTSTVMFIQ